MVKSCVVNAVTEKTGRGSWIQIGRTSVRSCWYRMDRKCLSCTVRGVAAKDRGWWKCREMHLGFWAVREGWGNKVEKGKVVDFWLRIPKMGLVFM